MSDRGTIARLISLLSAVMLGAALLSTAVAVAPSPANADVIGPPSRFVPLPPARILDTRTALGASGRVAPGGSIDLNVVGAGGVPESGVVAVALNVTLVDATGPGFVQVFPTGRGAQGASSNLNVELPGQTIPNSVVIPVGDNGRVTIYTQGGGHLVADVSGYFAAATASSAGRYIAVTPNRVLDTRSQAPGKVPPGGTVRVPIAGRAGVPASGAAAVVVNVTATEATGAGFVQVIPTGSATPIGASSNLNLQPGQTIPNQVMIPLGNDGSITIFSEAGTHVIVDVFGYFTGNDAPSSADGLFVPITPARFLDTRIGPIPASGSLTRINALGLAGVPASGVTAILGNLTATEASAAGFLQLVPGPASDAPVGFYSNVNIERPGQTIPNAAIANVGADGTLYVYASNASHVLFDGGGYFTKAAPVPIPPENPNRPRASFSATGAPSSTVTFTDTSTNSPTSWTWYFGDGATATGSSATHTYARNGTYSVTLIATNASGSDTYVGNVVIGPSPTSAPVAAFTTSAASYPAGVLARFVDQSTNATQWEWNFGDGTTSGLRDPEHAYDTPGTYTVTLTVRNAVGNSTVSHDLTIGPPPPAQPEDAFRTFQAEDAATSTFDPRPTVASDNPGFTGSGYMGIFGYWGQRVIFDVHSNAGGLYALSFRYRAVETGVARRVYVNGEFIDLVQMPRTATAWTDPNWTTTAQITVRLKGGENAIALEYEGDNGNKYVDLDAMYVERL
jgi:PKD repeat protein